MNSFWGYLAGRCAVCCSLSGASGLPRYRLPLSPFEIGLVLDWIDAGTINLEQDSAIRKLQTSVDKPISQWADDWNKSMDETTALKKLHSALNPVVLEFTLPELKAIVLWGHSNHPGQYGTGGTFRLPEEEILLDKIQRAIDRATAEG